MQKTPEASDSNGDSTAFVREKEAREDSIELAAAYEDQAHIQWEVYPVMETKAVDAASMDDAADDPAIWVHPKKPEQSLIFGSNKKGGLAAYNLEGEEVAYYPLGNINNVDVLNGLSLGDSTISIVGGSNRSSQSIEIFKIHPQTGVLEDIKVRDFPVDTQLIDDIYGFCFARSMQTGKAYCLINGKNGLVQQYEMLDAKGKLDFDIGSLAFDAQEPPRVFVGLQHHDDKNGSKNASTRRERATSEERPDPIRLDYEKDTKRENAIVQSLFYIVNSPCLFRQGNPCCLL